MATLRVFIQKSMISRQIAELNIKCYFFHIFHFSSFYLALISMHFSL